MDFIPRLALVVLFAMATRRPKSAAADPHADGLATRRSVLGDAHVARATRAATNFDRDFQEFITRYAWGEIWGRPGLPRKTRSLITIAVLAALGHEEELKLHVRATRNTGVSADEVKEVLMQVAVYAGVPAANAAFRAAKAAYAQMEEEGRR